MDDAEKTLETLGGIALGAIFEDYENAPPLNAVEDAASGKLVEVDPPAGDTPVSVEKPRDPDTGRFTTKVEPEGDPEGYTEEVPVETGEEAPEAPTPVAEPDPDGQSVGTPEGLTEDENLVLELDEDIADLVNTKYGGDLGAALRGLKEAQSLIGRQGSELGETRAAAQAAAEENAFYRELLDRFSSLEARMIPWQNDVDMDPAALAQEMVARAAETGDITILDQPLYQQAIETWGEDEPFKAAQFATSVNMARLHAAQVAEQAPPTTLGAEMESLKQRLPDIQQRLPAIQQEAEKRPALARLLHDEDPRTRASALEDLYHLSGGAGTPDTSAAARRIVLQAKAEADAAKADAAVVSATHTTPPPAPPKSGDDALTEALQEHLGLGDDFKIVG